MDYACPHCRELMRTDPRNGQPPPMCPRCGGDIEQDAPRVTATVEPSRGSPAGPPAAAPSLATFLHSTPPGSGSDVGEFPAEGGEAFAPGPQRADGPEAGLRDPTPGADGIVATDKATDPEPGESAHDLERSRAATQRLGPQHIVAADDAGPLDGEPPLATDFTDPATGARPAPAETGPASAHAVAASPRPAESSATPSFTKPARDGAPDTARWQWAALAMLVLTLVLQVLLADRARLAADAQWRPLLTSLCGVFGCSLPTWHEPDAFTMLSRDVRPLQGSSGALQVQATFRNDARWSQAWPVMRLSLSDADGRVVGARAFLPSEYLADEATKTMLAPGQSAQIMLQVREPRASVVAFSFDFH